MAETGRAQPLLQVRPPADPRQPEDAPREEHLIPYVPQIVPSYDPGAGGRAVLGAAGREPAARRVTRARRDTRQHHLHCAPAAGVVYVQPPPGLLDLGRQQLLLDRLK